MYCAFIDKWVWMRCNRQRNSSYKWDKLGHPIRKSDKCEMKIRIYQTPPGTLAFENKFPGK